MGIGRDYNKSNWNSNKKQQVRQRGLLLITLLLFGLFAGALAYLKLQPSINNSTNTVAQQDTPPKTQPPPPASEKTGPKYDFYNELPQREVVISKDELGTQKKPKQNKPKSDKPAQDANKQKVQQANNKPAQQKQPKPANKPKGRGFLVQAGAFSKQTDADRVKAQLALLGIRARIEAGYSNNNPIHRVRIGPLKDSASVRKLRKQLSDNNIASISIKLD